MDKAQIITLLFLLKTDTSHLKTISDYVRQFDVVEENVRSFIEAMEEQS